MKRILAVALLVASTAQAETFICEETGKTGLTYISRDLNWVSVDMESSADWVFVLEKRSDKEYVKKRKDGTVVDYCSPFKGRFDGELVCKNRNSDFRLDTVTGAFIETDFARHYSSKFMDYFPVITAGRCDLFKK